MARVDIDIDIEDYLDEVATDCLVSELRRRKKAPIDLDECDDIEEILWAENFQKKNTLDKLREILKLRPFSTKQEIINEIIEL